MASGCLPCMNHSFFGRIKEIQEIGLLGHTKLDFLFFRQKLVDIPITHNIYNPQSMKQQQKVVMCCCPFDKTHIIESRKLQKHIQKCKSPKRSEFTQCKFNPSHWILTQDANLHIAQCQNNIYADQSKIGMKLNVSSVSEICYQQSSHEDQSIIELINLEERKPKMNKKDNRTEIQKKKIFQELSQVQHKKENRLWEEPSFKQFCENYQKIAKKQKPKTQVVHYDPQRSDFF